MKCTSKMYGHQESLICASMPERGKQPDESTVAGQVFTSKDITAPGKTQWINKILTASLIRSRLCLKGLQTFVKL